MKRVFTANVWQEDEWFVAQAIEAGVTSQGESVEDALDNLREALELYYTPPTTATPPQLHRIEVEIPAG